MIKSLALGKQIFPVNIIQGPLAGYSNAPFRRLTWQHSQPAFSCTEMISSKALIHQPAFMLRRYVSKDTDEGPVCFQLSGNDPYQLSEAAKMVTDLGANLIDLNCGCPVNKIRRKGLGSSLLAKPNLLYKLITALKKSTHCPVSIKIRVQGESSEHFNREIAKVVGEAGTDFLIVHGRHWTEQYEIPCRYDDIKFFVKELTIPVIGNGDIACLNSLKKMFATGCDGVMLSRSGVGQPWLIKKLICEMQNKSFNPPSTKEIGQIFIGHVESLIQLLGNEKFAILQSRKLAKYYARGLDHKNDFMLSVNSCSSFESLQLLCANYFK